MALQETRTYRQDYMTPQAAIKIVLEMIDDGKIGNALDATAEVQKLTGKENCTESNYKKIRKAFEPES